MPLQCAHAHQKIAISTLCTIALYNFYTSKQKHIFFISLIYNNIINFLKWVWSVLGVRCSLMNRQTFMGKKTYNCIFDKWWAVSQQSNRSTERIELVEPGAGMFSRHLSFGKFLFCNESGSFTLDLHSFICWIHGDHWTNEIQWHRINYTYAFP